MAAEPASPVRWATAFLDVAPGDGPATVAFWRDVTGSSVSERRGVRGEFATLVPPDGDAYLRIQNLADGPARCHLDLHVDDVDAATTDAVALGAKVLSEDGAPIVVLASPGGFVFCLVRHRGESRRPAPVRWPGGHRSLVDQLCLDIPAQALETEQRFWSGLTSWPLFGSRSDFTVLDRAVGQPVRLIFQRLDDAEPGRRVTAHLDMSCDDVDAEVDRHLGLGRMSCAGCGCGSRWRIRPDGTTA